MPCQGQHPALGQAFCADLLTGCIAEHTLEQLYRVLPASVFASVTMPLKTSKVLLSVFNLAAPGDTKLGLSRDQHTLTALDVREMRAAAQQAGAAEVLCVPLYASGVLSPPDFADAAPCPLHGVACCCPPSQGVEQPCGVLTLGLTRRLRAGELQYVAALAQSMGPHVTAATAQACAETEHHLLQQSSKQPRAPAASAAGSSSAGARAPACSQVAAAAPARAGEAGAGDASSSAGSARGASGTFGHPGQTDDTGAVFQSKAKAAGFGRGACAAEQHRWWLSFADKQLEARFVRWQAALLAQSDQLFTIVLVVAIVVLGLAPPYQAFHHWAAWEMALMFLLSVPPMLVMLFHQRWYLSLREPLVAGWVLAMVTAQLFVAGRLVLRLEPASRQLLPTVFMRTAGLEGLVLCTLCLMVRFRVAAPMVAAAAALAMTRAPAICAAQQGWPPSAACVAGACGVIAAGSAGAAALVWTLERSFRRTFAEQVAAEGA